MCMRATGVLMVMLAAGSVVAGPLVPPLGAISSTGKTLTEVEPRIPISGPINIVNDGSYYLTGNIAGPAGGAAITISAQNVTLDLNGYTISGGQTGVLIDIVATTGGLVVQNGTIRNTTGSGVFSRPLSFASDSPPTTLRRLTLDGITDAGVLLGVASVIEDVSVTGASGSTSSSGITVGAGSRVRNVRVLGVARRGIDVGSSSTVEGATVISAGIDGVRTGSSCTVTGSTVQGGTTGFNIGQYSSIAGCTATGASGSGVVVDVGCGVKDCAVNNTSGDAFVIGAGSSVHDSRATSIEGNGFVATSVGGVTFDRCTVFNVELNGFQVTSGCVVTNSTVMSTGALSTFAGPVSSGVIITGSANRIEGNRFISCGYPVFLAFGGSANSVYRNAAANTTFGYSVANGLLNQAGTVRTDVQAVGPWDNTRQ
jgi:hypothetical protein